MSQTTLTPEVRSKPIVSQEIAFAVVHLIPLAAIWTGATLFDWIMCGVLYVVRMFWVTGGYHRYFAHKSYKTSRWFQFVIAFLARPLRRRVPCGGLLITVITIATAIHRPIRIP